MNKFRLFATLLVVALCIGFSSCGNNPLVGTTWVYSDNTGTETFIFTTRNSGIYVEEDRHGAESVPFTYRFNSPNITITIVENGVAETIRGEVRGNMMLFNDSGYTMVFRRSP